jgi:hypothetical protein
MSRIVNTDSPGKRRSQSMRTAAELIRRLSQKDQIDDDAKNMLAMLVYCFRQIDEGIDQSALAWEKRDYWMKAEAFRQRWGWAGLAADEIASMLFDDGLERLLQMMVGLLPHFSDIKITKYTRKESLWQNSYEQLMREKLSADLE